MPDRTSIIVSAIIILLFLGAGMYLLNRSLTHNSAAEKNFIKKELKNNGYTDCIKKIDVSKPAMDTSILSVDIDLKPQKMTLQEMKEFQSTVKDIIDNSYITKDIDDIEHIGISIAISGTTKIENESIYLYTKKDFNKITNELKWYDKED